MGDTFLFAANAVLPIVFLMALGYFLKRINFLDKPFLLMGNKLVFRVLLPVMLFLNVYQIEDLGSIDFSFVLYSEVALLVIFLLAVLFTVPYKNKPGTRGVLIQAMFRSNFALIGLSLASSLFGAEGSQAASLLSAFFVPSLNVLAVITLTIFTDNEEMGKPDAKKILLGIVKNPLIIGVVCGLAAQLIRRLFASIGFNFRLSDITPLFSTLKSLSACATPIALVVLGGRFEFSAVGKRIKPLVLGTVLRCIVVPVLALSFAFFVMKNTSGAHFAAYVAAFSTPVAVSSAIMAGEMGGDDVLAGQLVVFTSVVSIFTMFAAIALLRLAGVF
ncbi:MAG: AEC family transporter [Lachnospiraceae bacterium]|nr:AEC family transporter [Lachnospiraceae bacterium]